MENNCSQYDHVEIEEGASSKGWHPIIQKGRPPQIYSIDDAVKMVSDSYGNGGESMPCSV
jgi:hypothetical protein